jgi:integrase
MAGKLKPLDVDRETRPGKYADGDGLYLIVTGATSKNWSYRYWKDGKLAWPGLIQGRVTQGCPVVPLCDPALSILEKMCDVAQGELIFPNPDGGVFSENAMLAVLNRLGHNQVTVRGFRSTFATWAEESTDYPDGVREAALAHKYKSETTAAYQRGQKPEKRRALMKDWAEFLAGSDVIRLREVG